MPLIFEPLLALKVGNVSGGTIYIFKSLFKLIRTIS